MGSEFFKGVTSTNDSNMPIDTIEYAIYRKSFRENIAVEKTAEHIQFSVLHMWFCAS